VAVFNLLDKTMETATDKANLTPEELIGILDTYSQATERLKESHDTLQTEVRRLREELANKNRQLERRKRLAALGEMAAGLAHEIRNPLGGMQLYANLLRKDLSSRPEQVTIIDKMISGIRTIDALVTDVLALTHTVQPKFIQADLVLLVQSAVEFLQPLVSENHSQISFNSPVSLITLCDQNMLQRAVMNLVRNAIDASGHGGQVMIDMNLKSQSVVLHVADSGPGIDPEIADKIFNPFFTTKDMGTGLGLSIVHRIIEAHEGSIKVGEAPIGGALFTIKLPFKGEVK
jgi:signal transduction histidine kinase